MVSIFFIMFNPSNGIIIRFLYLITIFKEIPWYIWKLTSFGFFEEK